MHVTTQRAVKDEINRQTKLARDVTRSHMRQLAARARDMKRPPPKSLTGEMRATVEEATKAGLTGLKSLVEGHFGSLVDAVSKEVSLCSRTAMHFKKQMGLLVLSCEGRKGKDQTD